MTERRQSPDSRNLYRMLASIVALAGSAVGAETPDRLPLTPHIAESGLTVDSCADPAVLHSQKPGDDNWYMYCTTDPLNDTDVDDAGDFVFRRIPQLRSANLVDWEYLGDAFPQGPAGLPEYAEAGAALWAPDVVYSEIDNGDGDGQYLLFFGVTDTVEALSGVADCTSDGAIGVAFGETPTGPWIFAKQPVVPPRPGGDGCNFKWTFDPDVLGDRIGTEGTLYYGSYYGGIFAAALTLDVDGDPGTPDTGRTGPGEMVVIDNRYEGATVIEREGWFYIFVSATDCCNGALTGYSTFVGRSQSPTGPFLDQQGVSLTDEATGGTPFLTMTGDRWVGPGHNILVRDEAGGWWTFYHAVDRLDPFFPGDIPEGGRGFTKRPALMDAVRWQDGWPTRAAGGVAHLPGSLMAEFSDDFDTDLEGWTWEGGAGAEPVQSVSDGVLRVEIQTADTYVDVNSAQVLLRSAPEGDFIVETRLRTDVPKGCCFNFAQAGLGLFQDQDNLLKLTETAIFNTLQTEWAKEIGADRIAPGWSRYGNTVVGPPGAEWTYLRIAVTREPDEDHFTAYTSTDGASWVRGGTWTHDLSELRIALFAMGRQPETAGGALVAEFDYVRTFALETAP